MTERVENLILKAIDDLKVDNNKGHDRIIDHQKTTNGRVRTVEKKLWAIAGGLVVVSIIVVPLFLDLIK